MDKEENLLIPWLRSPLLIGGIDCYGDTPELEVEKEVEVEGVVGNATLADISSLAPQSGAKNTIESGHVDELSGVVKVVADGVSIDCSEGASCNPPPPGTHGMQSLSFFLSLTHYLKFCLPQVILLQQSRPRAELKQEEEEGN